MPNEKLCIICDTRKPEALFETKGEHIVPRSLGNRKLRTPHVCRECNCGLGGTVDLALKNASGVASACFDRDVGGARSKRPGNRRDAVLDISKLSAAPAYNPREISADVKGAVLKIAYEAAHLRLGNDWLRDPAAAAIREALFAYVNKDRDAARKRADGIPFHSIPRAAFYRAIGKSRGELIKRAVAVKSCLNALWLVPITVRPDDRHPVPAIACDIEGLPLGCVAVSESAAGVNEPALIWPL